MFDLCSSNSAAITDAVVSLVVSLHSLVFVQTVTQVHL